MADKHVRRLSTKTQLVALLYGKRTGSACTRSPATWEAKRRGFIISAPSRLTLDTGRCQCKTFECTIRQTDSRGRTRPALGDRRNVLVIDATGVRHAETDRNGRGFPIKRAVPRSMSSTMPAPSGRSLRQSRPPDPGGRGKRKPPPRGRWRRWTGRQFHTLRFSK